ncbi:MAG: proliferating cell nuclear antigen (pcna) [Candidatus Jordarchaeum sp.]|uniref:proliferating cell nuclear antigen (pcna) n=1 Tax=Candidatus Jordarchaeum sp. TaxID=2823881 RepID=UPI00404B3995
MSFKFAFTDAKLWKNIVDALSGLVDEVVFIADENSLHARAMDPSHVAMVDFELPKSAFSEYKCGGEVKLGINLEDMSRIMRRAGGGDELVLSLDPEKNKLNVTFKGTSMRTFHIGLLDLSHEETPVPSIKFNTEIKMTADALKEALKDAEVVSDHVTVEASPKELEISAAGDTGGVEVKLDKSSDALLELNAIENSSAMYALSYLMDMMKAAAASDTVTVQFSTGMPIKLEFNIIGGGRLTYWLAPRIEAE